MSGYPATEKERRVPAAALEAHVTAIFIACGMSARDAGLVARSLVAADLRGVHSHGVIRVPEYAAKLRNGIDPAGRPGVVKDAGAILVVDGGNSMGQIGAAFAMEQAIERARSTGVAVAAVRGSNHCGALFYYAMQALEAGMIGIATTNALPTMAPWGGVDKIVGINPLAVAIPAGVEWPIVLDAAFSQSSHGKIRVYQQKGLPIPAGWALDKDGRATIDPAAAIEGLLQPIGEYKGAGLAIAMGVLSSLLAGASYGTELGNMMDGPRPGHDGHLLMALNVASFEEPARFRDRVDGIVRQIRTSRRADGVENLYAPGGLEAETQLRYSRDGIPLNDRTWADLNQAAVELGVERAL